jgi:hypothetical protein
MSDYRLLHELADARRCRSLFTKAKPSNPAARLGIRYEKKVKSELTLHTNRGNFLEIEHNPWFEFEDKYGSGNCSPDVLLYLDHGVVVVEVKLRWVPVALNKLRDLYCPIVSAALNVPVPPLVICRYLAPEAPSASFSLREAITGKSRLLFWPANGHMPW